MAKKKKKEYIFPSFQSLSEITIDEKFFTKGRDGYRPEMTRFILLNKPAFNFLNISAEIVGEGHLSIVLHSSQYSGCIPIKSASTGIYEGSLMVKGRFNEDLMALATLLPNSIQVEFSDTLPLDFASPILPPIHLESAKYLALYRRSQLSRWKKFINKQTLESQPKGNVLWEKYALQQSTNPLKTLLFPSKRNFLTDDHNERRQLDFVASIALSYLEDPRVSYKTRVSHAEILNWIKQHISQRKLESASEIMIHGHDPSYIKDLKEQANKILNNKTDENRAWRIDGAELFERYVQHIFCEATQKTGFGTGKVNPRYPIKGSIPKWGLSYLEPDLIIESKRGLFIVDAKYKSHMLNLTHSGADLKESFRHDLHQLLAYSAIVSSQKELPINGAMLVYPSGVFHIKRMVVSGVKIFLIGLPLNLDEYENSIDHIQVLLNCP